MTGRNRPIRGCFITGTDTGVGKTSVCLSMIEALKGRGYRVAAMKPIACGGINSGSGVQNPDALRISEHITSEHAYETINPYALAMPAAPLIAARTQGVSIDTRPVQQAFFELTDNADILLVEGVGGWHVRLNNNLYMSDLVVLLGLPVVMVVGLRLGCINHAALTSEAIFNAGCSLHGWIANHIDPDYQETADVVDMLSDSIGVPPLAVVPYVAQADILEIAANFTDINLPVIQPGNR